MNKETDKTEGSDPEVAKDAAAQEQGGKEAGQENDKQGDAASLEGEIARLQEELKRAQAETINQARRMGAEIQKEYLRGMETVLNGMPEIVDDLERSLDASIEDQKAIRDGVAITLDQFKKLLAGHGIQTIEPEPGDRIDPQFHQAISKEESDKYEEHRILRLIIKGYRHGDRILRPASVVVSQAKQKQQDSKGDGKEGDKEET